MRDYDEYWNVPVRVKRRRFGLSAYGYNNLIIGICTILFIVKIVCDFAGLSVMYVTPIGRIRLNAVDFFLALNPAYVSFMPWQIITSVFVHADFWHFFVNMLVLFFFGGELEKRLSSSNYLKIFLLSGISGSIAYLFYSYTINSYVPALGASAAIFGVMGALAIIAPHIRVIIFPFPIPISIRIAIIIFALYDLVFLPFSYRTGIAHVAHLAGLLVGLYYGRRFRMRRYEWWSL